jgi:hypothetical protein
MLPQKSKNCRGPPSASLSERQAIELLRASNGFSGSPIQIGSNRVDIRLVIGQL